MRKWLAGIAGTVIAGVLGYYLTEGWRKPTPPPTPPPSVERRTTVVTPPAPLPPPPKILRGYLAVDQRSRINAPEDIGAGGRICAMKSGASFLRAFPPMAKYTPVVMPAPELYQAYIQNLCSAIFFSEREQADKLLPVNVTSMRLIPVYE